MTFISAIANAWKGLFGRESSSSPVLPAQEPTAEEKKYMPRYGGDYFLFDTQESTAMSVSTVYRCVNLLSESVASLPLEYKIKRDGIFQTDEDSRLSYLLNIQPNEETNAFDFWVMVVQEMLLEGNAYILPMYNLVTMSIDRFVLLSRGSVTYQNGQYFITDAEHGINGVYDVDEVIHIKGKTISGNKGVSVLHYAQMTIGIANSGNVQTLNNYETGGMVRGIVGNSDDGTQGFGEYQDSELSKTAEDADEQFRKGKRIVSLPGQVDFKPIGMNASDMQFLESRKFSVSEICRFFGVHPSFVFQETNNNYKDAENAKVALLSMTLNPILRKIEIELRRKIVPPSLAKKKKIEFDREYLNACDLDSKVTYQTKTLAAGLYTVNEWRQKENKPKVEGGDTILVSANLKGINEILKEGANNEGQE